MPNLIHITSQGERWDSIAWRYYGTVTEAGRVMAANPDVPLAPILPGGVRLTIPVIDAPDLAAAADLPPWCAGGDA